MKDLKVSELKKLCKKNGIKGYYKMNKKELLENCQVKSKIPKKSLPNKKSKKGPPLPTILITRPIIPKKI